MSVTRYRDVAEMPPVWLEPGDPRLARLLEQLMALALAVRGSPPRTGVTRLELAPPEEGGGLRPVRDG